MEREHVSWWDTFMQRAYATIGALGGDRVSSSGKRRVLNWWTLRFGRKDLEAFYMEHHWRNMSYWLRRSVVLVLLYVVAAVVVGDALLSQSFDVRMDHYAKESTKLLDGKPQSVFSNENSGNVDVLQYEQKTLTIPRSGFLAWHIFWCFSFITILCVDRCVAKRSTTELGGGARAWLKYRSHVAFGIMFFDLIMISFLNPSLTRFITFVYALLMRVQFVQTLALVLMSSVAMLGAGYVNSTHTFLNSVSMAEFLILNLICILASRQIEIHARLSLYRLCYIRESRETKFEHEPGSPATMPATAVGSSGPPRGMSAYALARELLSIDEIGLPAIEEADEDNPAGVPGQVVQVGALSKEARSNANDDVESQASSGRSDFTAGISVGSAQEAAIGPVALAKQVNAANWPWARSAGPKSKLGARPVPSVPMKGRGQLAPAAGIKTALVADNLSKDEGLPETLPAWVCIEGHSTIKRSPADQELPASYKECSLDGILLRGKEYLVDSKKVPPKPCAFALHQVHLFLTTDPLFHAAQRLRSLRAFLSSHQTSSFFVYVRTIPYKDGKVINVVQLYVRTLPVGDDAEFDTLYDKFVKGDDAFRNSRVKYLCLVREAPSIAQRAIRWLGGDRPVIIGKGHLEQRHFTGKNYVEVDVDVCSSRIARMAVGRVVGVSTSVVIDELLVFEGQHRDELPERPIGVVRWIELDFENDCVDVTKAGLLSPDESDALDPLDGTLA